MKSEFKLAFVHDWLTSLGGAEKVLESALEIYPQAPVYTLIYSPEIFVGHPIQSRKITPSFIQKLPGSKRRYRQYLPLMPFAIEQFDLRNYDVVLSSSDAVAHGVLTAPYQLHINYIHTPVRYAWRMYHQYLEQMGLKTGVRSAVVRLVLHYLRLWDYAAAARVDHFIANSNWVARDVWRVYRRPADVIYPPVEVDLFQPLTPREDYYITVSRLVPNKRIDLIVDAFKKLPHALVIVGDGPEYNRLAAQAPKNVSFLGWQPQPVVREMLGRAKGFVQAAEEEFGIALVEALASGCPVIAYGRGGVLETVIGGKTGLFFRKQTAEGIVTEITRAERGEVAFDIGVMRDSAERFSKTRFQKEISDSIERLWDGFSRTEGRNR
jgi:glycosyltransferase involved in cell wall biosynthesis